MEPEDDTHWISWYRQLQYLPPAFSHGWSSLVFWADVPFRGLIHLSFSSREIVETITSCWSLLMAGGWLFLDNEAATTSSLPVLSISVILERWGKYWMRPNDVLKGTFECVWLDYVLALSGHKLVGTSYGILKVVWSNFSHLLNRPLQNFRKVPVSNLRTSITLMRSHWPRNLILQPHLEPGVTYSLQNIQTGSKGSFLVLTSPNGVFLISMEIRM